MVNYLPNIQLVDCLKPTIYYLPTQRTVGTIFTGDYNPEPNTSAMSIPQEHYISTIFC